MTREPGESRVARWQPPAWISFAFLVACGPAAKASAPIVIGDGLPAEHAAARGTPCQAAAPHGDEHRASTDHVVRVAIEGADDPLKLCGIIQTAEGLLLDDSVVEHDIHQIWATGLVDDVKVSRIDTPDGPSVLFSVVDRPTFASTRLDGARGLSIDETSLPAAPGRMDPYLIHQTIRRLQGDLQTDGYRSAEISASPEHGAGGTELVFKVEAGIQTHIGKVILQGQQRAKEKDLLAAIRSAPGTPAAPDRAEMDRLLLQSYYYDHGMISAHVDDPELVPGPTPDIADLRLTIHEGDVYRIGAVHVTGDLLAQESEYLQKFWSSKKGDVFNRTIVAADLEKMREFHVSRGFEASIEPQTDVHEDKKTVDITVKIGGPSSH